jgi:hypothetical protein
MTKVNASPALESTSFKNPTSATMSINNARPLVEANRLQTNTSTATKATLSKCSKLNMRYVKKSPNGKGITTALPPHPHNFNYHHYNVNKNSLMVKKLNKTTFGSFTNFYDYCVFSVQTRLRNIYNFYRT